MFSSFPLFILEFRVIHRTFEELDPCEIGIQPLFFNNAFYCHKCGNIASSKTCPHEEEARLNLTGTKARRVNDYIQQKSLSPEDQLFPICYSTARALIKKLGTKLNVDLTPHDLRRYSATHASRNGVPLEIISKVLLRHQDLKTTQVYLGRARESEAIRWMDFLNGR